MNAKTTSDFYCAETEGLSYNDTPKDFISITNTEKCPFCRFSHSYQDTQDDKGIQRDTDGIWKTPKCRGKKFKSKIKTPNGTILYQADGVYLSIKPVCILNSFSS